MEASTDAAFSDVSVQTAAAAMGAVALDEVGASGLPHLPLELLSMVLSSSLGQCCRQLCTGLRDEFDSAQRGPLTLIARRRPPSSAIRALVTRCPRLRRVSLRSCADSVDDALLAFVLSALPELCTIDVSFCPLLTARVSLTALREFRSGRPPRRARRYLLNVSPPAHVTYVKQVRVHSSISSSGKSLPCQISNC